MAPRSSGGSLMLLGVNHRSATAAVRERLHVEPGDQPQLLAEVREAGLSEACVFATCERMEILVAHDDSEEAATTVERLLARRAGLEPAAMAQQSYRLGGEEALRHVFALAASLDSQVIGEPQILGQVKESHRIAAAAGMAGPALDPVLRAAFSAAKRVRSETALAEQPVSIAASALLVARNIHGDLGQSSGLIVGLSEMSELLALELKESGLADLVIVHKSLERAEAVARRLRCHFRPWDELDVAMAESDIVVAGSGSGRYELLPDQVEAVLKRRKRRPMFFIDASVPGDIDPAVERLDGAFVYDLEDLEAVAQEGKTSREAVAAAAWRIVGSEIDAFLRQRAERTAVPAVSALRRHFEAIREQILADGQHDADSATRLLINRLLHDPSEALRKAASEAGGEGRSLEQTVEDLFRIEVAVPDKGVPDGSASGDDEGKA